MSGFVDSVRIDELDSAIAELARAVNVEPYVDATWRAQWSRFVASWRAERDTYVRLGARLSVQAGNKRLDTFGARFQRFDAEWESGSPYSDIEPPTELDDTSAAWLLLCGGALWVFLSRGR